MSEKLKKNKWFLNEELVAAGLLLSAAATVSSITDECIARKPERRLDNSPLTP
jgi:hypothetical protein